MPRKQMQLMYTILPAVKSLLCRACTSVLVSYDNATITYPEGGGGERGKERMGRGGVAGGGRTTQRRWMFVRAAGGPANVRRMLLSGPRAAASVFSEFWLMRHVSEGIAAGWLRSNLQGTPDFNAENTRITAAKGGGRWVMFFHYFYYFYYRIIISGKNRFAAATREQTAR